MKNTEIQTPREEGREGIAKLLKFNFNDLDLMTAYEIYFKILPHYEFIAKGSERALKSLSTFPDHWRYRGSLNKEEVEEILWALEDNISRRERFWWKFTKKMPKEVWRRFRKEIIVYRIKESEEEIPLSDLELVWCENFAGKPLISEYDGWGFSGVELEAVHTADKLKVPFVCLNLIENYHATGLAKFYRLKTK